MKTPQEKNNHPSGDWRASFREAGPYLGLGMQLAGAMIFFVGAGFLLDKWLDTLPWLTIIGGVVGMVAVFVQIFRVSSELGKASKNKKGKNAGK